MTTEKREKTIENYLINQVKERGGFARKYTSPGRKGVPDRILFLPKNLVIFIEVKKPGGKLSGSQKRELARIEACEIPCGSVGSNIDVDNLMILIDNYLDEEKRNERI